MNSFDKLNSAIKNKQSMLCVGLDTDLNKLPSHLPKELDSILTFNKAIIEATYAHCSSYKINFAFYEEYGIKGIEILEKTLELIPDDIFTIADAKRGDIGNTSKSYAKAVFQEMNFDSITVSPYMGKDSVEPFLEFTDKMVFSLCLTSNIGSRDFQYLNVEGRELYKHVFDISRNWADATNLGFVVGATHPSELAYLRSLDEERYFLIPGIGAQGGDIEATIKANFGSKNLNRGLINSSRQILYASSGEDFSEAAKQVAINTNNSINEFVKYL